MTPLMFAGVWSMVAAAGCPGETDGCTGIEWDAIVGIARGADEVEPVVWLRIHRWG